MKRLWTIGSVAALLCGASVAVALEAAAADNPYQRGPDPTPQSISATTGPFATASVTVPRQGNFGGGVIYYPTDTSQGTFGAVAISPGLNGTWPGIAWLGPRLSSQGFVVFGIDTLGLNDSTASRGSQLLAALDYLTQTSSVRTRVDASRLAVAGHSMGGGGAFEAVLRRPTLKASIPNAPFFPGSAANVRVPTLITAMQNDSLVGQNRNAYNGIPAGVEKAYIELAGAGHNQIGQPTTAIARNWIPWLKIFVDNDARYHQFFCPTTNMSGLSQYLNTCPLTSATPPTSSPSAGPTTPGPTGPPPGGACAATYQTVNTWSGGYQGEMTVRAGNSAINGWTVRWTMGGGQISQVWNGTLVTGSGAAAVRNAPYNGALAAGATTTFGFISSGTPSATSLTCATP
ncbi:poly(ethylene terephthalate) hydrolase family protein [Phytohabitans aurantiacus]|uniref:Triacylglycerol lipase n=1 Tax=Phytohabitans aurantiacus TaxID=3016789 RepID=A0ABQ5R2R9_9ACTN|nr:cellulose binding domain-containing protein [Phytohabitans aurantiacus]GLI01021.1 triacylglycerol lipase [Phytohabitans aurantiacus]